MENKTQWKLPIRTDYAQLTDDEEIKITMCLNDTRKIAKGALDLLEEIARILDSGIDILVDSPINERIDNHLKQFQP